MRTLKKWIIGTLVIILIVIGAFQKALFYDVRGQLEQFDHMFYPLTIVILSLCGILYYIVRD